MNEETDIYWQTFASRCRPQIIVFEDLMPRAASIRWCRLHSLTVRCSHLFHFNAFSFINKYLTAVCYLYELLYYWVPLRLSLMHHSLALRRWCFGVLSNWRLSLFAVIDQFAEWEHRTADFRHSLSSILSMHCVNGCSALYTCPLSCSYCSVMTLSDSTCSLAGGSFRANQINSGCLQLISSFSWSIRCRSFSTPWRWRSNG